MLSPLKLGCVLVALAVFAGPADAQKFYPDDPLEKEPPLWPTIDPQTRALSDILELFNHTFGEPGERHPEGGVIPAGGVNTLGEVMDGAWFENRHARNRFSVDGLKRGPGDDRPPTTDARWRVLTLKKFGFRPGILIADSTNQLYLLRFDPEGWLEMATGADVVSSKILYALGYFVPENYIVYLEREQLALADGAESITSSGGTRDIIEQDIDNFLLDVARDPERGYRAVATRIPGSWEGLLGPYQVFGTRSDDPNDIVPHEHRRDLRGLFVFSSWIQHHRMGAVYTLDALVMQEDIRALVSTGQYSDPAAQAWIVKSLIERRNRIGATYFAKVLPLDQFEIENGELHFEDLAVKYGFSGPRPYKFQWSRFDNQAETHRLVGVPGTDAQIPPLSSAAEDGPYLSVQITAGEQDKSVRVYFRKESDSLTIVGVDRDWPGKVLADAHFDVAMGEARAHGERLDCGLAGTGDVAAFALCALDGVSKLDQKLDGNLSARGRLRVDDEPLFARGFAVADRERLELRDAIAELGRQDFRLPERWWLREQHRWKSDNCCEVKQREITHQFFEFVAVPLGMVRRCPAQPHRSFE